MAAVHSTSSLAEADVTAIAEGRHGDPFGVLGLHPAGRRFIARAFVPGAERLRAFRLDGTAVGELNPRHPAGVFEGPIELQQREIIAYEAANAGGSWRLIDPYLFGPV